MNTAEGPDMSLAEIAAGLSEAQRDALCGKFSFRSIVEQEQGEAGLCLLGLWNYPPLDRKSIRTPLGEQVRNHLKDQSSDR